MSWSALFDSTHIVKGVPVDADIELECRLCRTYFYTANAYYIGYSDLNYLKPEDEGKCGHNLKELRPTGNWFVRRDIHKRAQDGAWVSLFDYSHIVEGIPVDGDIELECRICKTLFYTKNAYYIGYSVIYYLNPQEEGRCGHDLKHLRATKSWFPKK